MSQNTSIQRQVRSYYLVFAALAALTGLTVAVSYLRLPMSKAVAMALLVATVKAGLVAAVFMHLRAEKKIIWMVLAFAAAFFFVLLLSPSWHRL